MVQDAKRSLNPPPFPAASLVSSLGGFNVQNAEAAIKASVDTKKHLAIHSSHPSPLGATKTARPFMGSDCFNKCNEYLGEGNGIDWDSVNAA